MITISTLRHAAIIATLLIPVSAASGAAPSPSPSARVCNPDALQTNDYVACLEKARADAERDEAAVSAKAFEEIAKGDLDAPEKDKTRKFLETAESEWRKYRDAECLAYARHNAGLGFGAMQFRLACLVDETMQRIEVLKARYDLK